MKTLILALAAIAAIASQAAAQNGTRTRTITVSENGTVVAPAGFWGNNTAAIQAVGDSRYPKLSDSFSDPAWITSLAWSKITGTPTTLAGYGITDASAAAPVQSVAGRTGNVTLTLSDIADSGTAASANSTDFAAAALASDPASVGAFNPSNWKTALAYTIADVPGLQGALDGKASISDDNTFIGYNTFTARTTFATGTVVGISFMGEWNNVGTADAFQISDPRNGGFPWGWVFTLYDTGEETRFGFKYQGYGIWPFLASPTGDLFSDGKIHSENNPVIRWRGIVTEDPFFPGAGDMCFRSDTSKCRIFTGDDWIDLN